MFNFNGMPYKRSGRAGGKSVSMVGMLVLLLSALFFVTSCIDGDTDTVEVEVEVDKHVCHDGSAAPDNDPAMCPAPPAPPDPVTCAEGTVLNMDTNMCDPVPVDPIECGEGTELNAAGDECVLTPVYDPVGETDAENRYPDGNRDGMIAGTDEADFIDGEGGNDSIKGEGGNDDIDGGPGDDTIYGGPGDDTLKGDTGNDTIHGNAGDDELTGGSGNNTLDGGDDEDIAIYLGAMQVTVDLDANRALAQHATAATGDGYLSFDAGDSGTGRDSLMNIENVKGTHGNDRLDGDGNANLLKGLDGADIINGMGGDDTILPNRPVMLNDMGVAEANTATLDTATDSTDGVDLVDGGEGSDTIDYQGESAAVTVNLGTEVAASDPDGTPDSGDEIAAHFAATVDGITDRIAQVNIGTEDEPNVVSTIENATGGFGGDTLTGDARANTLMGGADNDTLNGEVDAANAMDGGDDMLVGGAGDDTLNGGPGADTLMGGADNDTLNGHGGNDTLMGGTGNNNLTGGPGDDYYGVIRGDTGTVTETADADGGADSLRYIPMADVEATMEDESELGVGDSGSPITTPANVETVFGTANDDYIDANDSGAAVLGREGDDDLGGGTGEDTLVGCAGENTLRGGDGDDVFGVFNDGANADEIEDFNTGEDTATTDEIHLKGFAMGSSAPTFAPIADNITHAAVQVGGVTVATVTSATINLVQDSDLNTPGDQTVTKVQGIINALGKSGAVSFDHTFDPAKCSSN